MFEGAGELGRRFLMLRVTLFKGMELEEDNTWTTPGKLLSPSRQDQTL